MARLLLVDGDGRRRMQLEVAAQDAGHQAYQAGSIAEAMRLAEVYVPDAVIVGGNLPDGRADDLTAALRASQRAALREVVVVVPPGKQAGRPGVVRTSKATPGAFLQAAERALAAAAPGKEGA